MIRHLCPVSGPCRIAVNRWVIFFTVLLMGETPGLQLNAQLPVLYQDAESDFPRMMKEYDQGLYGRSLRSSLRYSRLFHEKEAGHFLMESEVMALTSGLRLALPGCREKIQAFAAGHQPDPAAQRALMLLGENAFDEKSYDQAIHYLSMVDSRVLSPDERSALHFKLGYSLFVRREFDQAASLFSESKEVRNKYYYPSNYYYGMTRYFSGDFEDAIIHFERVAPSETYKDYIPYYITQIYFSRGEYAKVIGYGQQVIQQPSVLNKTDIRHLLGQAYFETGDYESAIPHLAYVEKQSAKLRLDDFYQLAMAYYRTGRFEEAIPVFSQIRNESGEKAHYANYYLGHCYLNIGDKSAARHSLMQASRREEVPALTIESTFHYGRLCAEAGDDVEAIRILQLIPPGSPDYESAQKTLSDILTQTHDYTLAMKELEAMGPLSPVMQAAYQKVCLLRAEQLLQEGNASEATALLDKSLRYPVDRANKARCQFWKAEIAHQNAYYNESIRWLNEYFSTVAGQVRVPVSQSPPVAQYTQGYNYLRNNNYVEAQKWFDDAIRGLRSPDATAGSAGLLQSQILPDAILRAGDCAFKRNQYDRALQYYDESVVMKWPGQDYATYQKGIIKGLQQQPQEKIRLLKSLVTNTPGSLWADDALFQVGSTYQDMGQIPLAISSYEELVNRFGSKSTWLVPALLRLGLLHYNAGQFEEALVHYKAVFDHQPDAVASREAMAAIQEIYVNEWDKPDAYFEFAGSIPGFTVSGTEKDSILYLAAENQYAEGDYEKAVVSFEKYITQNPKGLYTLKASYLQAESYSLLKQYDAALAQYEKVIGTGQSIYYSPALYKAALIAFNHTRNMEKAYDYYHRYIPLADSEEKAHEALVGTLRCAVALEHNDDIHKAAEALIVHPRSTVDVLALAQYQVAKAALRENDSDKALQRFNEVIRVNSAELAAEARYQMAWIYHHRNEAELAARLAEEAARANVGYPYWVAKSLILLSDIHFTQGDLLNARAILDAIVENFQGDSEILKIANEKLAMIRLREAEQNRVKSPAQDTLELQENPKKD